MNSRWYIPPFKGGKAKTAQVANKQEINDDTYNQDDQLINLSSKLDTPEETASKQEKQTEIEILNQSISRLEIVLQELDDEHNSQMAYLNQEHIHVTEELEAINIKKNSKNGYNAFQEKVEAQKEEVHKLKKENDFIRQELDNITESEENLYFNLQEKKRKLKEVKEEFLKKDKEVQLYNQEYKNAIKELQEKLEDLSKVNKLEKVKNAIAKDYLLKITRKKEAKDEKLEDYKIAALKSEFRIVKLQIRDIDKEISEVPANLLNHSNSVISQTYDYTDSYY
jgi:chromosome segregation protein